jgi:hypothetical protein
MTNFPSARTTWAPAGAATWQRRWDDAARQYENEQPADHISLLAHNVFIDVVSGRAFLTPARIDV